MAFGPGGREIAGPPATGDTLAAGDAGQGLTGGAVRQPSRWEHQQRL
ncbi:MAG TPA: hypothetical protein VI365_24075 [Trebonia sp.]